MPATIVFSHANGFPAGTYRVLFDVWRDAGWQVAAVDKFGHDPRYPVSSNWPKLRDQLIDFIDAEVGGPAWLVGHSLGGLLSLLAACRRPDLAHGLVLLDSPVIMGWKAHAVQMFKLSGTIGRFSPARVSHKRRVEWASPREMAQHFAAKSKFARWDPRVLADYVASGTVRNGGMTRLAFDREIESHIYNTLPHHLGPLLRKHTPRCPIGFLAGTRSAEIRVGGLDATRALVGEHWRWIEGTHLFPMERPDETASAVLALLSSMPRAPHGKQGPRTTPPV